RLLKEKDDTSLYVGSQSAATPSTGSVVAMKASDASSIWSVGTDGSVNGLAVSDSRLFVGGGFTQIAGKEKLRLAALSLSNGALLSWNPQANDVVLDVAINGPFSRLLVGGRFGSADRLLPRSNIAAVSLIDGGASAWSANVNAPVSSLLLSADNATLYVGGRFSEIDGLPRNRLAALDVTAVPPNDIVTAWNPDVTGSSVDALALSSGDETLYIGGTFSA
ncbi:MAG: hypothetical protein GXP10_00800, partial [Gammaproteobacteria bacterium]|nr:hypothetical protein [Gammaproteobacteria bacterium]